MTYTHAATAHCTTCTGGVFFCQPGSYQYAHIYTNEHVLQLALCGGVCMCGGVFYAWCVCVAWCVCIHNGLLHVAQQFREGRGSIHIYNIQSLVLIHVLIQCSTEQVALVTCYACTWCSYILWNTILNIGKGSMLHYSIIISWIVHAGSLRWSPTSCCFSAAGLETLPESAYMPQYNGRLRQAHLLSTLLYDYSKWKSLNLY